MTTATQPTLGIAGFARQKCNETPVGTWFDENHELVIMGRRPRDDDDPLFDDPDFTFLAIERKGQYPELARLSFPCGYRDISDPLPYPEHLVGRIG